MLRTMQVLHAIPASARLRSLAAKVAAVALCAVLAACDTAVHVDANAVVPARYAHVRVTVKAVWFNESATAVPADETWQKYDLDKSETIDLVGLTGGTVSRLASELKVPEGTYRQVRLLLADTHAKLLGSAEDAGAEDNNEVTWFDEDGVERTRPLEVLDPEHGIGIAIATELKVKKALSEASTVQVLFDASRDVVEFEYSDRTGFLLNPTPAAFDALKPGTIRGTLNVSRVAMNTGTGRPDIEVTAQKLDKALGRHVVVGRASVARNGSFVLYPLPIDEDEDTTEYDVVIHGPGIQTIVVRKVPVTEAEPGNAPSLGGLAVEPADSYEANLRDADPVTPRSARVGFYQTLPDVDEPYLIAEATVDPLTGRFAQDLLLSRAATISFGKYGANFSLDSDTPEEGASRYAVAALSPLYGAGALADTTLRPASQASDTAKFSVPALGIPADAAPGTISTTLTIANPGRYDRGVLMVTHEGALVTVASLDAMLQQSPASTVVDVSEIPAGSATTTLDRGLYYIEAWTWDSDDPQKSFTRHAGADAVDLRSTSTATGTVAIE